MKTHKIVELLDEDHRRFSPLQRLLKTSANQKNWTSELHALLEPALHTEVEITNVQGPYLYILCRNAAVATRLRFLMADILPQLRQLQSSHSVREVKIRVSSHT